MVKSVAIIGGGASGAIALDSLLAEKKFDEVVLFERRDVLGGVWVLDKNPDHLDIPPGFDQLRLDPSLKSPLDDETQELKVPRSNQQRYIHTPSYEDLRTNVPEQLMTYSDNKHWGDVPEENYRVDERYIRGVAIQRYIEKYIKRHPEHVVYRTTVEKITKNYDDVEGEEGKESQFELTLRTETDEVDPTTGKKLDHWTKRKFDAVVVATGHYHVPFIPDVPGLDGVYSRYPSKIKHSKTFRATDEFKDKKIIVVGTRASGADIVQIASDKGAFEIYQSRRSEVALRWSDAKNLYLKPVITRYEIRGDTDIIVHFADGTTVENPDEVIYATGFRYSYPFLNDQFPNFTTGYILPDLYQHTFFIKDPYLSVIGVPTDAISFRAFEYQAVLIARFLSGKIELPPLNEQIRWQLSRFANKGNTRAYHTIDVGGKFEYLEKLTELGGGAEQINGTGRPFPVLTDSDRELHSALAAKFKEFFSESEVQNGDQANSGVITIPSFKP